MNVFFKKMSTIVVSVTILSVLFGFFSGYLFFNFNTIIPCTAQLNFIRTVADCEQADKKSEELSSLKDVIQTSVDQYIASHKATKLGVFVRDLKSTEYAGVNDNDVFVMASLLKVPLAIAVYKLAEVQPTILDQKIQYSGIPNLYSGQTYEVSDPLVKGQEYTIKDLVDRILIYSDNTATDLIYHFLQPGYFDLILKDVAIQFKRPEGTEENLVSARSYANLFRILYNSSYLNREYSNVILSDLSKSTFKSGAVAKLPQQLDVSHKFAERIESENTAGDIALRQLHDCGIVYTENKSETYIFCVMTEGENFSDLEQIQQDMSLEIYNKLVR